jgi:hypothetical protein
LVASLAIVPHFPGADDPPLITAPREGDEEVLVADMAECAISRLTMVASFIAGFEHGIVEDQGSEAEIDAVLLDVAPPLVLVLLEPGHQIMCTQLWSK